jgi:hypothetical protein
VRYETVLRRQQIPRITSILQTASLSVSKYQVKGLFTMATATLTKPPTVELQLRLGADYVVRKVSTAPPRECESSEIPVIDLSGIDGDSAQRTKIVNEVRHAAGQLGFFYIKNHGIDTDVIQKAYDQALAYVLFLLLSGSV